jgi:hypothetical protein
VRGGKRNPHPHSLVIAKGRDESELLVRGVCTTWADGGKSKGRTSTTLLGEDKGGVLPRPRARCGVGAGEGSGCCSRPQHPPEGLAVRGCCHRAPGWPPRRSPGWHPCGCTCLTLHTLLSDDVDARHFYTGHVYSGCHRRIRALTGAQNSQYRHPSPPRAVPHLTNDERRLNQSALGRSLGQVSSVQETDWSRWTTTAPGHSTNGVVRIIPPALKTSCFATRGRLSRTGKVQP